MHDDDYWPFVDRDAFYRCLAICVLLALFVLLLLIVIPNELLGAVG
jgi:hypothetical protein